MAPGATGIRPWRRARSPRCARSSVPEESAPETFPADFPHRQYRGSGSPPGYNAGSASSAPATHTTLFERPSSWLASDYVYFTNRHYRKCKRAAKALNFLARSGPAISASYRLEKASKEGSLCKALHFWECGTTYAECGPAEALKPLT